MYRDILGEAVSDSGKIIEENIQSALTWNGNAIGLMLAGAVRSESSWIVSDKPPTVTTVYFPVISKVHCLAYEFMICFQWITAQESRIVCQLIELWRLNAMKHSLFPFRRIRRREGHTQMFTPEAAICWQLLSRNLVLLPPNSGAMPFWGKQTYTQTSISAPGEQEFGDCSLPACMLLCHL